MDAPSNPNTFANNPLDRASERRGDADWLAAKLADPSSRIVPLWRLKPFLLPGRAKTDPVDIGWLRPGLLDPLLARDPITVFLGLEGETAHFAVDLNPNSNPEEDGPLAGLGRFGELREVAMRLTPGDAAILAQAKSMIDWHQRHGFCARCGAPTVMAQAGYKRDCPKCRAEHFPRTDPVVIMLPVAGDRCLLGRGRHFPKGMFSALAGFLEPGETIEDAVAREVLEETGIRVWNVRYFSTQPWPYPSSLMIGCFCDADATEITVDGDEIAEARWFSRSEIQAAMSGQGDGSFWVPPSMAIAHQLIKAWANEG